MSDIVTVLRVAADRIEAERAEIADEVERLKQERDAAIREIGPAFAEIERLKQERDNWEEDARRYCQNADYWRAEVERLKQEHDAAFAKITWLRELLADTVDLASEAMRDASNHDYEYEESWLDDARAAVKEQP